MQPTYLPRAPISRSLFSVASLKKRNQRQHIGGRLLLAKRTLPQVLPPLLEWNAAGLGFTVNADRWWRIAVVVVTTSRLRGYVAKTLLSWRHIEKHIKHLEQCIVGRRVLGWRRGGRGGRNLIEARAVVSSCWLIKKVMHQGKMSWKKETADRTEKNKWKFWKQIQFL